MLEALRQYIRGFRWPILLAMVALLTVGVLSIAAAERVDPRIEGYTARQSVWAAAGVAVFFAATLIHYRRLGQASFALFALTLVLLCAVFLLPARRGSHRWIYIPGLSAVNVQPSELAKLTFILALAWYLRYRSSYRRLVGLVIPFVITLAPLALILLEPDLGTSLLLLPTLMVMLFMAGARLRHLAVIVVLGLLVVLAPAPRPVDMERFEARIDRFDVHRLGALRLYTVPTPDSDDLAAWARAPVTPVAYARIRWGDGPAYDLQPLSVRVMPDRQAERIEGWLRQNDPRVRANMGFQQHQSMMILGSGRLVGAGRWDQVNTYFRMLPDDHTDFIFSVVGGQMGFVGCAMVIVLYGVIFVFGADIAISTVDPFGRLLSVGVLALLAAQAFINIGMTMGLTPITGMTLPLVSYGGSSLLVNCAALGLLVNVGQRRVVSLAPEPFDFESPPPEQQARMAPPPAAPRRRGGQISAK